MTRTSVQDTLKDMLLIMVQKKLINSGRFRFGLYSINRLESVYYPSSIESNLLVAGFF